MLLADVDAREALTAPHHRARIDQVDARVRDFYDALGLCIADEWTAYTALVTCDLFAKQSANAYRSGFVTRESLTAIDSLVMGNAALFRAPARVRS